MEEQHRGEYYRRNCMELSGRMRQRDVAIGALEQTGSREKIIRAVAYLREIQNGDIEKLDWYRAMVTESRHHLRRKRWKQIFKKRNKKKAKNKQNQARNGKDKVKSQPSEENTT
ncbi:hypothetical protein Tco_1178495 [Tanacetum coccineum]